MPSTSVAIVPAAGRGSRFAASAGPGAHAKLVAEIDGEPLLDRTIGSLLDAGVDRVVVVLPPDVDLSAARRLTDPRVATVVNPDPSRGMFSSIQVGLLAAEGDPMLVLPGDMPFVKSETVAAVATACRTLGGVVIPRFQGTRGHPIGLAGSIRQALLDAPATANLGVLLKSLAVDRAEMDVADAGILRDVDIAPDLKER